MINVGPSARPDCDGKQLQSAALAVAQAPQDARARIRLAARLCAAKRPAEAMEHLIAALRLDGKIPDIHNNMGVALRQMRRDREAVFAFNNAIRLAPHFANAHFNLANTLRALGRIDESIASYRRVVELREPFADAHAGLSDALAMQGNQEEAIAHMRRAVELSPMTPPATPICFTRCTTHHDQLRSCCCARPANGRAAMRISVRCQPFIVIELPASRCASAIYRRTSALIRSPT
ncbi:MAG TPA: tetratricopeptide repeat protein [Tepidisphaeraceae bacterium]|nr:tetratricopeptide repeat protein [Tepidisphaeraceae bacterium]